MAKERGEEEDCGRGGRGGAPVEGGIGEGGKGEEDRWEEGACEDGSGDERAVYASGWEVGCVERKMGDRVGIDGSVVRYQEYFGIIALDGSVLDGPVPLSFD